MKLLFKPVSVLAGVLAGLVGKTVFERLWALIDDEEPPSPEHRELSRPKLVAALLIEGAIFSLVKGFRSSTLVLCGPIRENDRSGSVAGG